MEEAPELLRERGRDRSRRLGGEGGPGRQGRGEPSGILCGPEAGDPRPLKGALMAVKDQEPIVLTEPAGATAAPAESVYKEDALETMAEARQRWEKASAR